MILGYSLNGANPWQSEILIAAIASVWMSDFSCPFYAVWTIVLFLREKPARQRKPRIFPGFPIHYPWQ
jgi:hypothetical protein